VAVSVEGFLEPRRIELGAAGKVAGDGHWRLGEDDEGIAWLVLDKKNTSINTLSEDILRELDGRLGEIERKTPKALVIRSAKPTGFIAGADIGEFHRLPASSVVEERLRQGHGVMDRLEALACPTITIVHGYALGGGFELALACDYRIAVDGARFGFPEVRLGLHPGLGGAFRLTSLIDPIEAMTMMLTGKSAHARKAKALGIVDVVAQERHVRNAVRAIVKGEVKTHKQGLKGSAVSLGPARALVARQLRASAQAKASAEHYPAPYALIDLWEEHGRDRDAMQNGEIASFAKLLAGPTAQNLIRVYFLRETLKRLGRGEADVAHVHVIGAGAMGGEIAAWCAIQGFTVSLGDVKAGAIAEAINKAAKLCDDRHLSAGIEKRDALDRLIPDPKGHGIAAADLVIEAVPERLDLKHEVYASVEPKMKQWAILATNTSSLRLEDLASVLANPARFAGLHFFNPVSKMELVEVVGHAGSDEAVLGRLRAFTGAIDRLPAPVASYPGFLVNRALTPYLLEALVMLDEGVDRETIDYAAEAFGMPMGPIELADQVGLDICLDVAESLKKTIEKSLPDIPDWLRDKVQRGEVGRKSGKGFYGWKEGEAQKSGKPGRPSDELTDRLILPMLDACVECLRKDVVDGEDIVDGAMVFATGFAPFRGGPIHYARTRGVREIVGTLKRLRDEHGPRFEPDEGWSNLG
jgi:3-hydroxyacyl-CoA dehydrogenase/enoyl-CoA hydratase/3-hydroxybutyryl-CoA epimerase